MDGGYLEDSGEQGLLVLLRSIERKYTWREWRDLRARMLVVHLTQEPPPKEGKRVESTLCVDRKRKPEAVRQEELLTPLVGLYNARGARGAAARFELDRYLKQGLDEAHVASIEIPLDGEEIVFSLLCNNLTAAANAVTGM